MSDRHDAPKPTPPPQEADPATAPEHPQPPSDGHAGTGGAPMHAGDAPDVD